MQLPSLIVADLVAELVVELGTTSDRGRLDLDVELDDARVVVLADRSHLASTSIDELIGADATIDLVIDHADDEPSLTRNVFHTMFSLVRPGGLYVVDGPIDEALVLQLMLASVRSPAVVELVAAIGSAVAIRRGVAPCERRRWMLDELWSDPYCVAPT
jgi:hypothetical protein